MKIFLKVLFFFALVALRGHCYHEVQSEMSEEYEKIFKGKIFKRASGNFQEYKSCKLCSLDRYPPMLEGNKVTPTFRYPWTVALQHKKNIFCSGAIISEKFILTSAHCLIENKRRTDRVRKILRNDQTIPFKAIKVRYFLPENITIGFLKHSSFVTVDGTEVEEVIPHPNYDLDHVTHDIGLLKLKNELMCDKFRNTVCLPSHNMHVRQGKMFYVTGWDTEWDFDALHTDPAKQLKVKNFYNKCGVFPKQLNKEYYCVENRGYKKYCHGSTGGPMFYKEDDNKYYVVGVASVYAADLCNRQKPVIYTSVQRNLAWIKKTLGLSTGKLLHSPGFQRKCKKGRGKCINA